MCAHILIFMCLCYVFQKKFALSTNQASLEQETQGFSTTHYKVSANVTTCLTWLACMLIFRYHWSIPFIAWQWLFSYIVLFFLQGKSSLNQHLGFQKSSVTGLNKSGYYLSKPHCITYYFVFLIIYTITHTSCLWQDLNHQHSVRGASVVPVDQQVTGMFAFLHMQGKS